MAKADSGGGGGDGNRIIPREGELFAVHKSTRTSASTLEPLDCFSYLGLLPYMTFSRPHNRVVA